MRTLLGLRGISVGPGRSWAIDDHFRLVLKLAQHINDPAESYAEDVRNPFAGPTWLPAAFSSVVVRRDESPDVVVRPAIGRAHLGSFQVCRGGDLNESSAYYLST